MCQMKVMKSEYEISEDIAKISEKTMFKDRSCENMERMIER